jgi:hypothetical protein
MASLFFGKHATGYGKRATVFHTLLGLAAAAVIGLWPGQTPASDTLMLRIYDWKTGELYVETPAGPGDQLFFGWIHSWEHIPWNEYYHIEAHDSLVLDSISFPAFGAGIPENKGTRCYIRDGMIHMEGIEQKFKELVWLNSHSAVQEILLDGRHVTRGSELPQHARLRLTIEAR